MTFLFLLLWHFHCWILHLWQQRLNLQKFIIKLWYTLTATLHWQTLLGLVKDPSGTAQHDSVQMEGSQQQSKNLYMVFSENTFWALSDKCESSAIFSYGNSVYSALIWFIFYTVKKIRWCQLYLSFRTVFLPHIVAQMWILYMHPLLFQKKQWIQHTKLCLKAIWKI